MDTSSSSLKTLQVRFALPLRPHQIPLFRGAVALDAGWDQDLFHNHAKTELVAEMKQSPIPIGPTPEPNGLPGSRPLAPDPSILIPDTSPLTLKDKSVNRYPLIHYRVEQGQAAMVGFNEGAQALRAWLLQGPEKLRIGKHTEEVLIDHLQERQHELHMLQEMRSYRIQDYIALNQDNYKAWTESDDLISRMQLVQNALTGHILGFAKAMQFHIPGRSLEVSLLHLRRSRPVRLHGVKHLAFGLVFRSNFALPPEMALGRGVSHGFGVLKPCRSQ